MHKVAGLGGRIFRGDSTLPESFANLCQRQLGHYKSATPNISSKRNRPEK